MFSYKQEVQDKTLWITPNAKFTSAQGGGGTNTSLARHLQDIWNTDARTLGTAFADLSTPDGAGSYKETLDVLSDRGFSAVTAARYDASVRLVNSAFSCPTFVDRTAGLTERDCGQFRAETSFFDKSASAGSTSKAARF